MLIIFRQNGPRLKPPRPCGAPEHLRQPAQWDIGPVGASERSTPGRITGLTGNTGYAKRKAISRAGRKAISPAERTVAQAAAPRLTGRTDGPLVSLWQHRWNIDVVPEWLSGPGGQESRA